jgi:hypothetical protein
MRTMFAFFLITKEPFVWRFAFWRFLQGAHRHENHLTSTMNAVLVLPNANVTAITSIQYKYELYLKLQIVNVNI